MKGADPIEALFDAIYADLYEDDDGRLVPGAEFVAHVSAWLEGADARSATDVVIEVASAAETLEESGGREASARLTTVTERWLEARGHPAEWWARAIEACQFGEDVPPALPDAAALRVLGGPTRPSAPIDAPKLDLLSLRSRR